MRYSRIDRIVTETMAGRECPLRFTLSGLEELESRTGLSFLGFVDTIGQGQPSLSHLTDAVWIALKGCDGKIRRDDAAALVMDYLRERGIPGLVQLVMAVMGASGIMGPEISANMLKDAGMDAEEEGKNGEAARKTKRRALKA